MKTLIALSACLALGLGACTKTETIETAEPAADTPAVSEGGAVAAAVSMETTARCGCAVESVGECGNYVQVGGEFVELGNWKDLGLDKMEWCGQGDVAVKLGGALKDGHYHAESLTPID